MLQRSAASLLRRGIGSSHAAAFSTSGVAQSLFSEVPVAPKVIAWLLTSNPVPFISIEFEFHVIGQN